MENYHRVERMFADTSLTSGGQSRNENASERKPCAPTTKRCSPREAGRLVVQTVQNRAYCGKLRRAYP